MLRIVVCIALLVCCAHAQNLSLTLLTNPDPEGAVCLDGSPPGYYFATATNASFSDDWIIFIQGGGWCYQEWDCLGRSRGNLGSSNGWASSVTPLGGPLSRSAKDNPDFYGFNQVVVQYCDGASFSGDVSEPVTVNGTQIFFRGRRILTAVINDLIATKGFDSAKSVLLTGCSAGGLTTFLHGDYVGSVLPKSVTKYGVMPGSGYFLLVDTVENKPVYPNEMEYVYNMQNASSSLSQQCQEAFGGDEAWKCIFAQEAYRFMKSPTFILNSAHDSWQTGCIFTSEPVPDNSTQNGSCGSAPGWSQCYSKLDCSADQVETLNEYADHLVNTVTSTGTYSADGNGAFIHSCYNHCGFASTSFWNGVEIDGVKMNEAAGNWWNGIDSHHLPCTWSTSDPGACNPTC